MNYCIFILTGSPNTIFSLLYMLYKNIGDNENSTILSM